MATANFADGPDLTHGQAATMRVIVLIFGVLCIIAGIVLLFNPVAAATSLAWLIGLALALSGILDIAASWSGPHRWLGVFLGALLVIGGIIAVAWPHITLWALALLVGIDLIVHGIARLVLGFMARREVSGWGWAVLAGVVNIAIGIAAMVWPKATVFVLAVLLGIQVLVFGIVMTAAALRSNHSDGDTVIVL